MDHHDAGVDDADGSGAARLRRGGGEPPLTDPGKATTVRFVDGSPAPTDGPFAKIKESLAGYWVVECTHERALQIAAQVVAVTEYPLEVRRVMDEPPAQG
ncbi:hypothetical protein GCM10018962_42570 [Dactylosporangium matsuzakiense]|uniref:YCII-related domain-containing protein n=1 Tax=Dactylosporangium matsuzakiense TaxID=53360 RepID=A0A9W6NK39_9ACTN|nr:hypothetical protein Dmats_32445 [Dactylosporangium matsuzakiense]GLK99923.1 hypothetical protein GCM10017581_016640 [Dactylosporangium matsuzakiense]